MRTDVNPKHTRFGKDMNLKHNCIGLTEVTVAIKGIYTQLELLGHFHHGKHTFFVTIRR
jgi:hypothetical protein